MVKIKQPDHYLQDGSVDIEKWLGHLSSQRSPQDVRALRQAMQLVQATGGSERKSPIENLTCMQQGVILAEILFELNLDTETLMAALLYPSVVSVGLRLEDVAEQMGKTTASLLAAVLQMDGVSLWHKQHQLHIESMRKMLLAMVQDVRAVFVKLADRLCLLRHAEVLQSQQQEKIANEVMDIYAPLANRLGLGQLKWELEDLSFRYLQPDIYKTLAKLLDAKRLDRERYIQDVVSKLQKALTIEGMSSIEVYGRAKHIYSIYRKMQRKSVGYEQIYDVSAVRVLVDTVEQCYQTLSVVHSLWEPIAQEFDDYIVHPKSNGYRSLHTAVIGPKAKNLEVQIRTHEMHQISELGVAAHWMYKEGRITKGGYEQKIAWLRQVLAWQKDLADSEHVSEEERNKLFNDRVYVFTPKGDIVDLPSGATVLDLAYHIHSEVGHRCRGAKVNAVIAPLTHVLQTGERVEIITGKESQPSRDWLSPHHGYLTTARARAKVHHWFKQQDFDRYVQEGMLLFEKEYRHANFASLDLDEIAQALSFKTRQDLFSALGSGDLRISQLNPYIEKRTQHEVQKPDAVLTKSSAHAESTGVAIQGVSNLLSYTAKCCKPIPGEAIVGFITKIRGVAIHRQDCLNIIRLKKSGNEQEIKRLIEVSWGDKHPGIYPVDLYVIAHHREGLLRDLTTTLSLEKVAIEAMQTRLAANLVHVSLTVQVSDISILQKILERVQQLPSVVSVTRQMRA